MYIPTSAPKWPGHQGGASTLQWDPSSWYHASALCAAAVDTATLPFRLSATGAQPGIAPTGIVDMDELMQIITRRRSCSELCLGALFAGLPAPVVRTPYETESAGDPRQRARTSTQTALSQATVSRVLPFSEGTPSASGLDLEAESVVLRGPRTAGGRAAAETVAAAAALDEMLMAEELQRRALRHRCVALQPLPLPRSFPHIFSPPSGRTGTSTDATTSLPESMPVLTRLQHTGASRSPTAPRVRAHFLPPPPPPPPPPFGGRSHS